jgi:hypothetical protein
MTAKTFKRAVALCLLTILLVFVVSHAQATGWGNHDHPHEHETEPPVNGVDGMDGANGVDGMDGADGLDLGVSSEEFAQGLSLSLAAAGMDFTSTTTKLQLGISASWYDGENGLAVGVAQVVDWDTVGDTMLSLKLMGCNGCSNTAGVVSAVINNP